MSNFTKAPAAPGIKRWRHPAIKACPDCGEKYPTLQRYVYIKGAWVIRCDRCLCRSVAKMTPKEAVQAWNKRNLTYAAKMFIRMKENGERGQRKNAKYAEVEP